ncbi:MAG: NAD(P)H-dependent oxidoreductase [Bacteroidales bacterium]|nr:NAD(P)H-dependent oxidoreductase [Bacteroidales bacterium]
MKTLIVYNHPHEGSFCSAIREAVENGLRNGGHECRIIHLDQDGFDPVMREKDLKAFVMAGRIGEEGLEGIDPIILKYMKKLQWAEHIVMIFPIWWMTMPAMMKGFIDKVIFPGIVYKMEDGEMISMLSKLRQVTVITTMNTPQDIYKEVFGNSIEGSLIKGTFNKIGIHDIRWISLNMVKQSGDEKRWLWLDEIETEFAKQ